jgi:UDP-N-acetylglucosamine diphosphorylase/glucosamine-1-phosphate N-acetyltransferase
MHPVWEILIGTTKIYQKYERFFPNSNIIYNGRKEQTDSFFARTGIQRNWYKKGSILSLDASIYVNIEFFNKIISIISTKPEDSFILTSNNKPFGIYLSAKDAEKSEEFTRPDLLADLEVNIFSKFEKIDFDSIQIIEYLFDAIYLNSKAINDDIYFYNNFSKFNDNNFKQVCGINSKDIYLGKNVKILPNVVLDATDGPIIIDDEVTIMPQATILGPAYIGKNTIIKIGAKIYHNNSFGEWCKIGGEVEESIIQGYSNKQHEGFLGHSFLGEWVNLGADTNTSDLKNTYSNIKIRIENNEIDTKKTFLGLLCGDHTKSGINTMFTTGSVVGICGILVREWFLPNFIPSFSWGGGKNSPIYKVDKAIETARIVMKRRNKELTPEEEKLMKMEYERVLSLR